MAMLLVTGGQLHGELFRIPDGKMVTIGRDDECTIQVLDKAVSRKHMQIRCDAQTGMHIASDYRSANGILVDGKRVVGDVELVDGQTIELGSTKIVYLEADHSDAKTALDHHASRHEWKRDTMFKRLDES